MVCSSMVQLVRLAIHIQLCIYDDLDRFRDDYDDDYDDGIVRTQMTIKQNVDVVVSLDLVSEPSITVAR